MQELRPGIVVDCISRRLTTRPVSIVRNTLDDITGNGDIEYGIEKRISICCDLVGRKGGIVDCHAIDVAVEVVESAAHVCALGAVAYADNARQADSSVDTACKRAVN